MKSLVNDSFVFHAARNSDKIRNDLDENNQVISTKHAINRPCSTVRLQVCFRNTVSLKWPKPWPSSDRSQCRLFPQQRTFRTASVVSALCQRSDIGPIAGTRGSDISFM